MQMFSLKMFSDDDDYTDGPLKRVSIPALAGDAHNEVAQYLIQARHDGMDGPFVTAAISRSYRRLHTIDSSTSPLWKFAMEQSLQRGETSSISMDIAVGWKDAFITYFRRLRKEFARLRPNAVIRLNELTWPSLNDSAAWFNLYEEGLISQYLPCLHQGQLIAVLKLMVSVDLDLNDTTGFTIFAILVALDEIMDANEISILRQLGRKLLEDDSDSSWPVILLAVMSDVFGQKDLM